MNNINIIETLLRENSLLCPEQQSLFEEQIRQLRLTIENTTDNLLEDRQEQKEDNTESEDNTLSVVSSESSNVSDISTSEIRQQREYTEEENEAIVDDMDELNIQLRRLERRNRHIDFSVQIECAENLFNNYLLFPMLIFQMVIGLCQSGKTALIRCLLRILCNSDYIIPPKNIVIITGLSSKAWKKQMSRRMPKCIRVFHRNNLSRNFVNYMRNKTNVLIIIDEIQIAAKNIQTVSNSFRELGYFDGNSLMQNQIHFFEISATPNGLLNELRTWNERHYRVLKLLPGNNYTGVHEYRNNGKIFQYKELCGWKKKTDRNGLDISYYLNRDVMLNNIREIKTKIRQLYPNPKYHVIRTKTGIFSEKTIDNFKEIFPTQEFDYVTIDSSHQVLIPTPGEVQPFRTKNVNDYMIDPPDKHTFLFIKEMCRCSITYAHKQNLGVSYERKVRTPDDSVMNQGAIGRMCGYNIPEGPICFTNIPSIDRYIEWWDNDFPSDILLLRRTRNTRVNPLNFGQDEVIEEIEEVGYIPIKVRVTEEVHSTLIEGRNANQTVKDHLIDYLKGNEDRITDPNDIFDINTYLPRWRKTTTNRWRIIEQCFTDSVRYNIDTILSTVSHIQNTDYMWFMNTNEKHYIYILLVSN
jgi:hypothetical protein